MNKITEQSVKAFLNGESFEKSNTRIIVEEDTNGNLNTKMYLHNNLIAKIDKGLLSISSTGWKSRVTKKRLNGLPGVNIYQKDYLWYLNGEYWDGKWIQIK